MKFPAFEPINFREGQHTDEVVQLTLSNIVPDKTQFRKKFDTQTLDELAQSIKQYGVIQPIIVKKINEVQYQLIAGERRWRAAHLAKLTSIPALIRNYPNTEQLSISLIENIQRENLNPIEEAQALERLIFECEMTHHQIADRIGRSREAVSNLLRLLTLCDEVKIMLRDGDLEMGHARALVSLTKQEQIFIAQQVIQRSLSVRKTEQLVKKTKSTNSDDEINNSIFFADKINQWLNQLPKKFNSKVKIQLNEKGNGRLVVYVHSPEEMDWLINKIQD